MMMGKLIFQEEGNSPVFVCPVIGTDRLRHGCCRKANATDLCKLAKCPSVTGTSKSPAVIFSVLLVSVQVFVVQDGTS